MAKGPLTGCKVVNIKAVLYDGSYHDVDSNEMAFKIAASLAFKKGIVEAKPCLLEPIMKLKSLLQMITWAMLWVTLTREEVRF